MAFLERKDLDLRTYIDLGDGESKLNDLKERIVCAGLPIKFFKTPAEMVALFEADMAASVAADFGDRFAVQSPLQREQAAHEAFGDARVVVYEGGAGYAEAFRSYLTAAADSQSVLLLAGSFTSPLSIFESSFVEYWGFVQEQAVAARVRHLRIGFDRVARRPKRVCYQWRRLEAIAWTGTKRPLFVDTLAPRLNRTCAHLLKRELQQANKKQAN